MSTFLLFDSFQAEVALRLGVAALLGGLIGLEREMHGQAAGLRTHMVLAVGSCLAMLVSVFLWETQNAGLDPTVPRSGDPGRIAAHVLAGIGFLGAGAIIRFGTTIKGLTTAACLWTAAGIGMAVGAGFWLAALVATLLTLITIFLLDRVEKSFISKKEYRRFVVEGRDVPGMEPAVAGHLRAAAVKIGNLQVRRDFPAGRIRLVYLAALPEDLDADALVAGAGRVEGVEHAELE